MTWQDRTTPIQIGDTVRLSRSLAESLSDPDSHKARGTVADVREENGFRLASVEWNRPEMPDLVNVLNLVAVRERGKA